jgi:hypothetical protein
MSVANQRAPGFRPTGRAGIRRRSGVVGDVAGLRWPLVAAALQRLADSYIHGAKREDEAPAVGTSLRKLAPVFQRRVTGHDI